MKTRFLTAPLIACLLLLTSCQVAEQTAKTTQVIADIRSAAVEVCGFLPTIKTVSKLIDVGLLFFGGTPVGGTVAAGADAICTAVRNAPFAEGKAGSYGKLNGVELHGKFVK